MAPAGAPDPVGATVDHLAIQRLQSAYADVVSRRSWSELTDLFLPDARIEVDTRTVPVMVFDGPDALGSFIAGAIERFGFFEFVVLNAVIELASGGDPDAATARVWMCEMRTEAASGEWNNSFGIYHDRYQRTEDGWRFAHRRYHSLARTADAPHRAEVYPFPDHLTLGD